MSWHGAKNRIRQAFRAVSDAVFSKTENGHEVRVPQLLDELKLKELPAQGKTKAQKISGAFGEFLCVSRYGDRLKIQYRSYEQDHYGSQTALKHYPYAPRVTMEGRLQRNPSGIESFRFTHVNVHDERWSPDTAHVKPLLKLLEGTLNRGMRIGINKEDFPLREHTLAAAPDAFIRAETPGGLTCR